MTQAKRICDFLDEILEKEPGTTTGVLEFIGNVFLSIVIGLFVIFFTAVRAGTSVGLGNWLQGIGVGLIAGLCSWANHSMKKAKARSKPASDDVTALLLSKVRTNTRNTLKEIGTGKLPPPEVEKPRNYGDLPEPRVTQRARVPERPADWPAPEVEVQVENHLKEGDFHTVLVQDSKGRTISSAQVGGGKSVTIYQITDEGDILKVTKSNKNRSGPLQGNKTAWEDDFWPPI